jgi:hypothetical protein
MRECDNCGETCHGCDDQDDPHLCSNCKAFKSYEVEFWPGQLVTVKAVSEEDALDQAIQNNGWMGSSEHTGNGLCFKVWVREKR